jgi:hypothetical protein
MRGEKRVGTVKERGVIQVEVGRGVERERSSIKREKRFKKRKKRIRKKERKIRKKEKRVRFWKRQKSRRFRD